METDQTPVWTILRRLSGLSVLHSKPVLDGIFVWARRALNNPKRRFSARADSQRALIRGAIRLGSRSLEITETTVFNKLLDLWDHGRSYYRRVYFRAYSLRFAQ